MSQQKLPSAPPVVTPSPGPGEYTLPCQSTVSEKETPLGGTASRFVCRDTGSGPWVGPGSYEVPSGERPPPCTDKVPPFGMHQPRSGCQSRDTSESLPGPGWYSKDQSEPLKPAGRVYWARAERFQTPGGKSQRYTWPSSSLDTIESVHSARQTLRAMLATHEVVPQSPLESPEKLEKQKSHHDTGWDGFLTTAPRFQGVCEDEATPGPASYEVSQEVGKRKAYEVNPSRPAWQRWQRTSVRKRRLMVDETLYEDL